MVMSVKVTIDDAGAKSLLKDKLPKTKDAASKGAFKFTKRLAKSIRTQLISQTYKASRAKMAARIYAKKINNNNSAVMMPQSAIYLDSMKPHFVSLKRGRLITRWARTFYDYGATVRSGFSKVRSNATGGIRRGSQLFVTPDPFIEKGMSRVRNTLGVTVLREINKLFAS